MLIKLGCGGVDISTLHPKMRIVLRAVEQVWSPEEPIITSTWEGTHSSASFHYFKRALDFRLARTMQDKVDLLRSKLGKDYDIVLEHTHIHIEYDPKGG